MDWGTSMNSNVTMSQASIWFDQNGFVGKRASLLSLSMNQGGWNQHLRTTNTRCLANFSRVGASEATTLTLSLFLTACGQTNSPVKTNIRWPYHRQSWQRKWALVWSDVLQTKPHKLRHQRGLPVLCTSTISFSFIFLGFQGKTIIKGY